MSSEEIEMRMEQLIGSLSPDARRLWDRVVAYRDAGTDFYEDGVPMWLLPALERLDPDERTAFLAVNRLAKQYYQQRLIEDDPNP